MSRTAFVTVLTLAAALVVAPVTSTAAIIGPYTADANTLHLWHLDESGAPAVDSVMSGGQNLNGLLSGATLGNAAYPGFGTSLNTNGTGRILLAASALSASGAGSGADSVNITLQNATTRAFTWEALLRLDFDPAASRTAAMHIIAGEGEGATGGGTDRQFQFRLDPVGFAGPAGSDSTKIRIEFNNFNAGGNVVYATLPTTGLNAPTQNDWFHVAMTYNGTPGVAGNTRFFWTKLDLATTEAALVASVSGAQNANVAFNNNGASGGATNTDLSLGNEARSTGGQTEPFIGLVDEVRMSSVVRGRNQFIFRVPEPASGVTIVCVVASLLMSRRRVR
jgi:hypothetical protein